MDSASQAALVIIRHAPITDQPTSQATMTQTATVLDSGKSSEDPGGAPIGTGRSPPGARIDDAPWLMPFSRQRAMGTSKHYSDSLIPTLS